MERGGNPLYYFFNSHYIYDTSRLKNTISKYFDFTNLQRRRTTGQQQSEECRGGSSDSNSDNNDDDTDDIKRPQENKDNSNNSNNIKIKSKIDKIKKEYNNLVSNGYELILDKIVHIERKRK